jgi:RIP homotypic interaction motif
MGAGMDSIALILTALAAGASAGALDTLKDEAKEAAKAAYGKLRGLVGNRFRETGTVNGEAVLAEYEADPESFEKGLGKKLAAAGAGDDEALVAAANALLELLNQQGGKSGKYSVTITGSQGVQVGDHGTQTNTFSSRPASG